METIVELAAVVVGVAAIVWGAEAFAEHLSVAAVRLGVSAFALAVLLAGAEPEELAAARRGVSEAVVAGVVGSFAYNVTMSLGAGALARPLHITGAGQLHGPWLAMIATLAAVLVLAAPRRRLGPAAGWLLLVAYPVVVAAVLTR